MAIHDDAKVARSARKAGLLARLRRDKRGNTLALFGASLIPMVGFIGSGVDMSRAYLVKTRMQQACDAGAIAGRKSMSGTTLTQADKDEAERYFRYNFPNGTLETHDMPVGTAIADDTLYIGTNANGQLAMTAKTTMPNKVMQVLGFQNQPITVSCTAEEYYVNTDVMLVLDTTGSMNCAITDPTSCSQATEKSNSKMKDLRNAVERLYADLRPVQTILEGKSLRLRVGWVNFSTTVNVGKLLYAENPAFVNNPGRYRNASGGGLGTVYYGPTQSSSWMSGTGASDWNGCIVERDTAPIATYTSSVTSIPSSAYDQDIGTTPSSEATRWTPHVPSLYKKNNLGATDYSTVTDLNRKACSKPAFHLTSWPSTAALNAEVDKITTGAGYTYHDIGMNWGVRMIANSGVFGARNPDTFNNVKVRRTIVLVTDGDQNADGDVYGAYGVERYDGRVIGTSNIGSADFEARHAKRFSLMCSLAKSAPLYADVWVIAVLDAATPVPATMTSCASNSAQVIKASDTAALQNAFKAVSDKVGNLRIGG